jgi:predicted DNA-binding protein (UPF0251 family)
MPRPRLLRRVKCLPEVNYFKPAGVAMVGLKENILTVDEFEALRLKDLLGLGQEEASKKMKISQPTFHRLVLSARKKVAEALVKGKAIKIEGGMYEVVRSRGKGLRSELGAGAGRGLGRKAGGGRRLGRSVGGRMGGPLAAGPIGKCICAKCGRRAAHQRGVPCYQIKCKKCGSSMTRG